MFGSGGWLWVAFGVAVLAMLVLDLGVLHRKAHAVGLREAAVWSAIWIALSLAFNGVVYHWLGPEAGLQFLTAYLIEKSLSVDNIFVFVLIFSYFAVPAAYQHRVLFWGVLGALVMRGILIATGVALIEKFHWIIYLFGLFLIFTGWRMARPQGHEVHPEANPVVRLARRFFPIHPNYEGQRFFLRQGGRLLATPLFLVLLIVESTDLVFALDSIPAVLAISADPFIVYTSNVFAILGLRALYFLLAGVVQRFRYLRVGLSVVLVFVGVKMVVSDLYEIPISVALGFVASVVFISIAASLLIRQEPPQAAVYEKPSSIPGVRS